MLRINVKVDDRLFREKLKLIEKQVPFATALALTKTAQAIKPELVAGMASEFQQPTSFTLNSLTVSRAEKKAADIVATIGVKGAESGKGAVRWLSPEVYGGERSHAIEALLRPLGLPPSGMYAVPGKSAKLSGAKRIDINWFRSLIADISEQGVSNARGIVTKGTKGTRRRKGQGALQYFVLMTKWGKLQPGIYGRRGRGIFPFVIFVRQPKYSARFDFYGIAQRQATARFPDEFKAAMAKALASAR
jgi:hypothetical protein